MMNEDTTHVLAEIIKCRRTRKPAQFSKRQVPRDLILELIEIARYAPNHHRTEPARFYLLDPSRIKKIGKLFGEVIIGNSNDPVLIEKGNRKTGEWGNSPGLLIVTCHTDRASPLIKKNPGVIDEDYATCSCICQNLLLLMESEKIASKWSTGAVWEHPEFPDTIGMETPLSERVVGLIFYGYSEQQVPSRTLTRIDDHLLNYM